MSKDSSSKFGRSLQQHILATSYIVSALFVFFAGQILGVLAVLVVLLAVGNERQAVINLIDTNNYVKFVIVIAIGIATVGILYSAYKFSKRPFLKSIGLLQRPKRDYLLYAVVAYIMYFIIYVIAAVLIGVLVPIVDVDQSQQLGFSTPAGLDIVFVYLSLVIVPAMTEEILFRGFLFQRLKSVISLRSATLLTSILFGLLHLEFLGDGPLNWIAAVDTFILSVFLISVLVQTKSLWASIFLHGLKNSVAFVFLFII